MKKEIKSTEKKTYIAPDIEVVEIEMEQNILQNGSISGNSNDVSDMTPEDMSPW